MCFDNSKFRNYEFYQKGQKNFKNKNIEISGNNSVVCLENFWGVL